MFAAFSPFSLRTLVFIIYKNITYNMYKGRQYCIARFRPVSIDGDFLSLFLLLYVQGGILTSVDSD